MVAYTIRVGKQGRFVLPRALRDEVGAEEGALYVAHVEDDRLVLETRAGLLRRMQREVADAMGGDERSLVDELLGERRAEAERESDA